MFNLSLRQQYFDAIKSGAKTAEGRLNKPRYKDLKPGMHIRFTALETHEVLVCTIKAINTYPNFEAMLKGEGLENMLPGIKSIEEGVALYESLPGYKEEVKKVGALAIKI